MPVTIYDSSASDFQPFFRKFCERNPELTREAEQIVREIVDRVRREGDVALFHYSRTFDDLDLAELANLKLAIERVTCYHKRQLRQSWFEDHEPGVLLGQKVTPLDRVGVYVPGGKASYPSSVIMNVLPARVAGVSEVIMVSPAARGYNPAVLAAAVGIDMVAGPSEILVLADHSANPEWVAADMLSQAEHDELAVAVVMTPERGLAEAVQQQLNRQLEGLERKEIARQSLSSQGAIIVTRSLDEALSLANIFAAEHLELAVAEPLAVLSSIRHAGAIFLGHYTPEALGDYLAGPNHVLPTGGTARFSSPLGVDDFLKRSSILSFTESSLAKYAIPVQELAGMEGLEAHGMAVKRRISDVEPD